MNGVHGELPDARSEREQPTSGTTKIVPGTASIARQLLGPMDVSRATRAVGASPAARRQRRKLAFTSGAVHYGVMSSRARRRRRVVVLVSALAAGLLLLVVLLRAKGMAWAGEFGSIAAFFLALITVLVPWIWRWWRYPQGRPASLMSVEDAADKLAKALESQWVEDEHKRHINDPYAMPVRWAVTRVPVATAARPHSTAGENSGRPLAELAGRFEEISEAFHKSPFRRLVITGPAGAGKSVLAIQLAIQLLNRETRAHGGPVPVILPVANWNPDVGLSDWIASQLITNRQWLADYPRAENRPSLAKALVPDHVIPILDGLDELPERLRAEAIEAINAYGSNRPLVVTSREKEYAEAVADRAISRAMEVQLLPLRIAEVEEYLKEATTVSAGRWDPVFSLLETDPSGPLAAVLATPLMLWLARTIYGKGERDPGDLAEAKLSGDQAALEHHLIAGFVPAVYDRKNGLSRFGCTSQEARRWLAFLAAYSDDTRSADLRWWTLTLAVRGWWPVAFAVRAALLFGTALALIAWLLRQHRYWWRPAETRRLLISTTAGRHLLPYVTYIQELLLQHAGHSARSTTETILGFFPQHSLLPLEFWLIPMALVAGTFYYLLGPWEWPRVLVIRPVRVMKATFRLIVNAIFLSGLTLAVVFVSPLLAAMPLSVS